jgi:hypothetical protein
MSHQKLFFIKKKKIYLNGKCRAGAGWFALAYHCSLSKPQITQTNLTFSPNFNMVSHALLSQATMLI